MSDELHRLQRERDLYFRLLTLGTAETLDAFLEEALALVCELAGADQGYLELRGEVSGEQETWRIALGFSDAEVDDVQTTLSTGIMAEALSSGQTVVTPAAFLDPRFKSRGSVKLGKIAAVVCAPIGTDAGLGVLYLHSSTASGKDGQAFSESDRERVEIFARHVAPFADRLLTRRERDNTADATLPYRDTLRADMLVGKSPVLAEVLKQISLVAPLDVNVLLTGPTGSGKSLVARVIHDNGPRSTAPFVELNCATLSSELIENELFGAHAGAHSTASHASQGKVRAAEGGTLFLDEIAELPLESQAKILHLLQTRQYFPLGSNQPVPANIRLISATNTPISEAMRDGRFREDLFYRLQFLPIAPPALTERLSDLPALCDQLIERACRQHGLRRLGISRSARNAIRVAEWPGNVRQLAHALEAAAIRAGSESLQEIKPEHVFPSVPANSTRKLTWGEATRDFQRHFLLEALDHSEWNMSEVSRNLDLARSHIYSLINSLEIKLRPRGSDS